MKAKASCALGIVILNGLDSQTQEILWVGGGEGAAEVLSNYQRHLEDAFQNSLSSMYWPKMDKKVPESTCTCFRKQQQIRASLSTILKKNMPLESTKGRRK